MMIAPGWADRRDGSVVSKFRPNPWSRPHIGVWLLAALLEFDGRYWPFSIVSLDRNSQTMKFVQPNILNRSSLSVGENDGFAHEFRLSVPKRDEDRRRAEIHNCHGVPEVGRAIPGVLL